MQTSKKERVRKVNLELLDEETFVNVSGALGDEVRKIVDQSIKDANRVLNIYGLKTIMQIQIEKL